MDFIRHISFSLIPRCATVEPLLTFETVFLLKSISIHVAKSAATTTPAMINMGKVPYPVILRSSSQIIILQVEHLISYQYASEVVR